LNYRISYDGQNKPNQGNDEAELRTIDEGIDKKRETYRRKSHADGGHQNANESGAREEDHASSDDENETNLKMVWVTLW
jgi:hypothetical protein